MKTIGKEWENFSADHLSPSQLNKNTDQWFYDYKVLTADQRKKLPPNAKMVCGGWVGQCLQDIIVHNLTVEEVIEGKKK